MPRPNGTTAEVDDRELDGDNDDSIENNTPQDVEDNTPDDADDDSLPSNAGVTAEARTNQLEAKVKELNSRIGSLVKANDDRIKATEKEWQEWGENYRKWAISQIDESYARGKQEAEDKFLPMLSPEEKANYYDQSRQTEKERKEQAAQRQREAQSQRQQVSVAVQAAIDSAKSQGVPVEALDLSTPQSVFDSALKYIQSRETTKGRTPKPKTDDDESDDEIDVVAQVADLQREINRLKRDQSGDSRTGTSTGGQIPNSRKALEEAEQEMEKAKRKRDITGLLRARRKRDAILQTMQR